MPAEQVLRLARTEAVTAERVPAREELETVVRHDDVKKAGHPAHRAVALERFDWWLGHLGLITHRSAMASTLHPHSCLVGTGNRDDKKAASGAITAFDERLV
jgi:hypothetical protein